MDPRVVAYLNPGNWSPNQLPSSAAGFKTGVEFTSALEIRSVANQGSASGTWLPGTNAQVSGQGAGPAWSATAINGCPGLVFTAASKQTLKLEAPSLSLASGIPSIAIIAALSATFPSGSSGQSTVVIGAHAGGSANPALVCGTISNFGGQPTLSNQYFDNNSVELDIDYHPASLSPGIIISTTLISPAIFLSRINGKTVGSASPTAASAGFTATQIVIGYFNDADAPTGLYYTGAIGAVLVLQGTLPSQDISYFESQVAASCGVTLPAPAVP